MLRPTGAAIGLVENATFETASVDAQVGDMVAFYTDGVVEAVDAAGEEFGTARLTDYLLVNAGKSAPEIIKGLRDELHWFTRGKALGDDTTILACRRVS